MAERGTCQDTERNILSEAYSRSGEHKEKARSEHVKNVREQQERNNKIQYMGYVPERTNRPNTESQSFSKGHFIIGSSTYPE